MFSHTHLVGAGICDYGQLGIMPISTKPTPSLITSHGYFSDFSHSNESASPGYYGVSLLTPKINAEVTTTANAAIHRYTWTQLSSAKAVLIDLSHAVKPGTIANSTAEIDVAKREIRGSILLKGPLSNRFGGFTLHFAVRFNVGWTEFGVWNQTSSAVVQFHPSARSVEGTGSVGAYFVFDPNQPWNRVEFKVGISSISQTLASSNIDRQIGNSTFEEVLAAAQKEWEQTLSTVVIHQDLGSSATHDDLVQFYSAMYRTHLAPTMFDEYNSQTGQNVYRGFDKNVHVSPYWISHYYSDMSIWDTHRTEMPWLALLNPSRAGDMVSSLLLMYQQGGDLPRWPMADGYTNCMIGTHAIVIITDSVLKGAKAWTGDLYTAMVQAATKQQANAGRVDVDHYIAKGYVSYEASQKAASETLEYAYDDWVLGNYADKVMNLPTDAQLFWNRSRNYRNVWNPSQQIFCPRKIDGSFICPSTWLNVFDPLYVEGDAWHWRWFVPQDPLGLVDLFGSADSFVSQLETFMQKALDFPLHILPNPYYWAGNEPDIFAPWMFNFAGRPDLTQKWTRHQLDTQYSSNADGIPGNDDFGTLSAWYIFAALGFYPQAGSDRYLVGSPKFTHVTIKRPLNTGDLEIVANNASSTNIYVSALQIDGIPINMSTPWFSHEAIRYGAKLEFWMSSTPHL